jgi:hypothetical protein
MPAAVQAGNDSLRASSAQSIANSKTAAEVGSMAAAEKTFTAGGPASSA